MRIRWSVGRGGVIFLVVLGLLMLTVQASAAGRFIDDDGHTFESDIEALAAAGVTKGCNPPSNTKFCPDDFVTRGQMAAFLVRALGYTDNGGGNLFTDDNGHTFESDIDKLGTAGVTKGCNPPSNTKFCPDDSVTRGQMAAFLTRALNLQPPNNDDLILYQHGGVESASLATIRPDGSSTNFIPTSEGLPGCAAWSADKSQIAYNRAILKVINDILQVDHYEIVTANADGSNEKVLVIADGCPTWSPQGDRLAYSGDPDGIGVWIINSDGTNKGEIAEGGSPAWSPKDDLIAVVGEGVLWTTPVPGSGGEGGTVVEGGMNPDWHPNGSKLVFELLVNGAPQIFTANADGTALRQITTGGGPLGNFDPAFSPDGQDIVFTSTRDGGFDLYIIGADGTNIRRLTNTPEDEFPSFPDW